MTRQSMFTDWHKSSYSSGGTGNCVEVAVAVDRVVGVRDSKQHGRGPVLAVATAGWREFLTAATNGAFGR